MVVCLVFCLSVRIWVNWLDEVVWFVKVLVVQKWVKWQEELEV